MATFDARRVSDEWAIVLTAARADGVRFRLNSGQRTFAEQDALRKLYLAGRGPLAAKPSHDAPHIRTGRPDHALDVDMYVGDGVRGLARWLQRAGASVAWTVPGEGWHIETPRADLERLARSLTGPIGWLTPVELRRVRELDAIRTGATPAHPDRERVLVRVLTDQRKRIWRAAQNPGGWTAHNRAKRYRSLLARTR